MIKIKESSTQKRLLYIMETNQLKQVDILNKIKPLSELYNVKFSKSNLSLYLSGKSEPNQDKLFILSEALNVNVAWLMGYDVPMAKYPQIKESEVNINSNSQSNIDIDALIAQKYSEDCMKAIALYAQLDLNDRAEIRGEMKHMLKGEKYSFKNMSENA